MQGVFIANQLTASMLGGDHKGMGGMKMKPTVLTKITYNGGGTWQNIKAPSKFNNQKCDRCGGAKECSLHLHGEESCSVALMARIHSHAGNWNSMARLARLVFISITGDRTVVVQCLLQPCSFWYLSQWWISL